MGHWISWHHSSDTLINRNMVSSNLHSGLVFSLLFYKKLTVKCATLSSWGAYKITTILWMNCSMDFFSAKAYCFQRNIYYKGTGLAAPQKKQKYIMTYCKNIFWWSHFEFSVLFHKNPLLISSGAMQDCANKKSNNLNKIWKIFSRKVGLTSDHILLSALWTPLKRGSPTASLKDTGLLHHTPEQAQPPGPSQVLCVPRVRFQMDSSK